MEFTPIFCVTLAVSLCLCSGVWLVIRLPNKENATWRTYTAITGWLIIWFLTFAQLIVWSEIGRSERNAQFPRALYKDGQWFTPQ